MFCAYNRLKAQILGEHLQDHWYSGLKLSQNDW